MCNDIKKRVYSPLLKLPFKLSFGVVGEGLYEGEFSLNCHSFARFKLASESFIASQCDESSRLARSNDSSDAFARGDT